MVMNNRYIKLENRNIKKEIVEERELQINDLIKNFFGFGTKECITLKNIKLNIVNEKFDEAIEELKKYIDLVDTNLTNAIKIKSVLANNIQYINNKKERV